MSTNTLPLNSLVLYKQQPARVTETGSKKIQISTPSGNISVRHKDVMLLHPGPLSTLSQLTRLKGEIETARELLVGEPTDLETVAELIFGEFTPQTAWAVWELVADGVHFTGDSPESIRACSAVEVAETVASRRAKANAEAEWKAFISRVNKREVVAEDGRFLQDVIQLAYGQDDKSKVLKALRQSETRENAHKLLLNLDVWDEQVNPYPQRSGVSTRSPEAPLSDLAAEPRRDLTHLTALAIDDEGSTDPDDAISWDNGRLWVHIADVAALVPPDSPADLEARGRGANLYLPEGTVTMLPPEATAVLGLGLQEKSPALSIGLRLNDAAEIEDIDITPSWVKVTRLTYAEADRMLLTEPLAALNSAALRYEQRRLQTGAIEIDLPEVRVKVVDGVVSIRPLPNLRSRNIVRDAMLMAGEAVARYAFTHNISVPYTIQDPPFGELPPPTSLSNMFARRRFMQPSQQSSQPGAHHGLGMGLYAQATSPLRRYLDLVVHQQLRAHLRGETPLDAQGVMARVGAADAISREVRWCERQSLRHWTLVYLMQNPDWYGEGVVVDRRGNRDVVLIPELALDMEINTRQAQALDSYLTVKARSIRLPQLEATFQLYEE